MAFPYSQDSHSVYSQSSLEEHAQYTDGRRVMIVG